MPASLIIKYAIELIAVLLLALGIKGLSKVRSARGANQLAAVAMGLAVVGLLFNYIGTTGIAAAAWIWHHNSPRIPQKCDLQHLSLIHI